MTEFVAAFVTSSVLRRFAMHWGIAGSRTPIWSRTLYCAHSSAALWTTTGADGLVLPLEGNLQESYVRQQIGMLNSQMRRASAFAAVDGINSASLAALAYAQGIREVCGDHITHAYGNRCEARPLAAHDVIYASQAA